MQKQVAGWTLSGNQFANYWSFRATTKIKNKELELISQQKKHNGTKFAHSKRQKKRKSEQGTDGTNRKQLARWLF